MFQRVSCSSFPAGSATLTPVASPARLALRATATDAAPRIVFAICVLAVAARLILINQPYVDHWSWRQSDVAAIARNFLQNGFRFGYPQIDWAGNAAGYVGTEFPILPFIAALCYKFAGIHEWVGRIQAVILFAVSLPCFFLLVREIFGSTAAVWATFFYSFAPVNIFAGRSFMPDVPSLSFAIVGLYLLLRYVDHNESSSFFVAAIALSLSFLIKITSIVIVAPLVYLAVAEGADLGCIKGPEACSSRVQRPRLQFALFALIALVPSIIWYWHAHQIAEKFYPHHFFGAGGIRTESFSWYSHIAEQTLVSSLTPAVSAMALVGLFVRAAIEILSSFSLVAGCHDCFHHHRRLWQSPPVVSTSAGSDCRCLCRCRMCLCWIQNLFACGCNHVVDFACNYVPDSCLSLCSTVL